MKSSVTPKPQAVNEMNRYSYCSVFFAWSFVGIYHSFSRRTTHDTPRESVAVRRPSGSAHVPR
jgi:hypothetical protein